MPGSRRRPYDEKLLRRGARLAPRVEEGVPECWMCSSPTGPRAKEHIFPRWLLKDLGAEDEEFGPTHRSFFGTKIDQRGPIRATAFVAGEVCKGCNGGWMNELEKAARAILSATPPLTAWSRDDQYVMARWFVKTAVVLNTSQNYRLMIPAPVRHAVSDGIPPEFAVFLNSYTEGQGQLEFAQQAGLGFGFVSVDPEDEEAMAKVQEVISRPLAVWIRIREVVATVAYAPPSGWAEPSHPSTRIWPSQHDSLDLGSLTPPDIWPPFGLAGRPPVD